MPRASGGVWITGFAVAVFAALAVFLLVVTWVVIPDPAAWALAAVAAVAGAPAVLFGRLLRDRRLTRIRVVGSEIELALPRDRDLSRPPPLAERLTLSQIAAVATRTEFFGHRVVVAQQAYALRLHDGRWLRLGADRPMREPIFGPAALALAQRIGGGIADLGGVEVATRWLGTRIGPLPPWGEASLPQARLVERAHSGRRTWQWVSAALAAAAVAKLLSDWL